MNLEKLINDSVVEMSDKATKYSNLISVLRALEALKQDIPDKQFLLVQMVLYLLDRIFPNQTWNNKLKFLESDLSIERDHSKQTSFWIRDEKNHLDTFVINNTILDVEAGAITDVDKPFCFKHSRHLVPAQEVEAKEPAKTELVYESQDYEISELKNSLFLEQSDTELVKMFSSWKETIQKSKLNKKWIMQEWLAATKFWRIKLLKRSFRTWVKNGSMMAQAHVFRYHTLVDKPMIKMISTFRSRKRALSINLKRKIFSGWKQLAQDTLKLADTFYAKNIRNRCFQIISHSFNYRRHLLPTLNNHLKYYHSDLQLRAFLALKTEYKRRMAEKEKQIQLKSNVQIFKKEKHFYFWFDSLKRLQKLKRFTFIQNHKLQKSSLYRWQTEYKARQSKQRDIAKLNELKMRQLFIKWKLKHQKIQTFKNNVVKIVLLRKRNLFTQRFGLWKSWAMKHHILCQNEKYLLLKRSFKLWGTAISNKQNSIKVSVFQKSFVSRYFSKWKTGTLTKIQLKKVIQTLYISRWKSAYQRRLKIRLKITNFKLKNVFKLWKTAQITKRTKHTLRNAFYTWRHIYLVKQMRIKSRRKSLNRLFNALVERRQQSVVPPSTTAESVIVAETVIKENSISLEPQLAIVDEMGKVGILDESVIDISVHEDNLEHSPKNENPVEIQQAITLNKLGESIAERENITKVINQETIIPAKSIGDETQEIIEAPPRNSERKSIVESDPKTVLDFSESATSQPQRSGEDLSGKLEIIPEIVEADDSPDSVHRSHTSDFENISNEKSTLLDQKKVEGAFQFLPESTLQKENIANPISNDTLETSSADIGIPPFEQENHQLTGKVQDMAESGILYEDSIIPEKRISDRETNQQVIPASTSDMKHVPVSNSKDMQELSELIVEKTQMEQFDLMFRQTHQEYFEYVHVGDSHDPVDLKPPAESENLGRIRERQNLEISSMIQRQKRLRTHFITWKRLRKEQILRTFVAAKFENIILKRNYFMMLKAKLDEVHLNIRMIDLKRRKMTIKWVLDNWRLRLFKKSQSKLIFNRWKNSAIESIKGNLVLDLYNAKLLMKYFYFWKKEDVRIKFHVKDIKKVKLDYLVSVLLNARLLFTTDGLAFPDQNGDNSDNHAQRMENEIKLVDHERESNSDDIDYQAENRALLHYRKVLLRKAFNTLNKSYSKIITNLNWAMLTSEYRTRMQSFLRWKQYLVTLKSDKVKLAINKFKLKRFFLIWHSSYCNSQLKHRAVKFYNQILIVTHLNIWISVYNKQIVRNNKAVQFYDVHLQKAIRHWKNELIKARVDSMEFYFMKWIHKQKKVTFIRKRIFGQWKRNLVSVRDMQSLAEKYDRTRLYLNVIKAWKKEILERKTSFERFHFLIWKYKFKSRVNLSILRMNRHITLRIMQNLFNQWKFKFKTKMKAIYAKYKLFLLVRQKIYFAKWKRKELTKKLNSYFEMWKLEKLKRLKLQVSSRLKMIDYFSKWKYKTDGKLLQSKNSILLRRYLTLWKVKCQTRRNESIEVRVAILKLSFNRWKRASKKDFEKTVKGRLFNYWQHRFTHTLTFPVLKMFFERWKKKNSRKTILRNKLKSPGKNSETDRDYLVRYFNKWKMKAITKQYFKKWQSSFESKKFDTYRKELFSDMICVKQLKKMYFYCWKNRSSILNNI